MFHEISEADHRILNPLSGKKLLLLGDVCSGGDPRSHLDLACGKGEMLCQWASRHGNRGVGLDINLEFVAAARRRAAELDVSSRVEFICQDAATVDQDDRRFEIVSCIGATWIGGGLVGTLNLMRRMVVAGGLLVVGEPFWNEVPAAGDHDLLGAIDDFATLAGTAQRCDEAGAELVEMIIADHGDWDRYQASQWRAVDRWLLANPEHDQAANFRSIHEQWRRAYLDYGRRRWGWGVFVLRAR